MDIFESYELLPNIPGPWFFLAPSLSSLPETCNISCIDKHVFMPNRKEFCVVLSSFFPDKLCYKILFPKNLVADFSQRRLFSIINTEKDETGVAQKAFGNRESWIDHCKPVRMETPPAFRIADKSSPFFSPFASGYFKFFFGCCKIVFVNEVLARVIRRINVDQLDLAEVGLLEEFQGVQVVTFDEQVLGGVEVYALFSARAQSLGDGGVCGEERLAFARPVELVAFLWAFHDGVGQFLLQLVKIYRQLQFAVFTLGFGHTIREQLTNASNVLLGQIRGVHLHLFHHIAP